MSVLTGIPGLTQDTRHRLEHGGVYTAADFYSRSTVDIVESSDLPYETIGHVRQVLATNLAPRPTTVHGLGRGGIPIPTGLPGLDGALHGGLCCGNITEIVGPAGLGKTQFCLAATSYAAVTAPAGHWVLYIDAERKFAPSRLLEISRARGHDRQLPPGVLLDRVLVLSPSDCSELLARLQALDPSTVPLSLIVVDSIAQLARLLLGNNPADAASRLAAIAGRLKVLAGTCQVPTLIINQVAGSVGTGADLSAALGTLWAHAINARLVLHQPENGTRYVQVAKSPLAPVCAFPYRITAAGPVQIEASEPGAGPIPTQLLDASRAMQEGNIAHTGIYTDPC